jgi:hypothetical protein
MFCINLIQGVFDHFRHCKAKSLGWIPTDVLTHAIAFKNYQDNHKKVK